MNIVKPTLHRCHRHSIRCWILAFGLSGMFASSAMAQKVVMEFDEGASFSQFKTFAIRDGLLRSASPALNNDLMKKHLEEAIERAFTERGLTKATGSPDLNLSYILGSRAGTENSTSPGGPRGQGTRVTRTPHVEGNFIVSLRSATTGTLVWHATATVEEESAADVRKKLDDMVRKAIAKYPPKK